MKIFNVEIFHSDADHFLALSCADKKEWIKENTNQTNDELIEEFIKTVVKGEDECAGCKKAKSKPDGISKGVPKKVATVSKSKGNTVDSGQGDDQAAGRTDEPEGSGV